ncbi:MAG: hypothetical protein FIA95_08280 [Gemmatimonadetes bacterium]|nr:hypothetical protein [Gemmatimonadota bacterium]
MKTRTWIAVWSLALLMAWVSPVSAQRLLVHGYATQAIGSTTDYAQAGLGVGSATTDIRAAALQARLMFPSWGTQFVVQGTHRRVGSSPVAPLLDDVELDWAFAQQSLFGVSLRAGRLPMAKGLINEIRDVGTVLPFYKAPAGYYIEGFETVDGVAVRYGRSVGPIQVEAEGFRGTVPVVMQITTQSGPKAMDLDGENTSGGQITLGLPIDGLRLQGGWFDSDVFTTIPTPRGPITVEQDWDHYWGGVEYVGSRLTVRAEHGVDDVPGSTKGTATYVQGIVPLARGLSANAQWEKTWVKLLIPQLKGHEYDPVRDVAFGLAWAANPNLVLKAEHHWFSGYQYDEAVSIMGPAVGNRYFLVSIAASF